MANLTPASHREDAQKLTGDGLVDLFEITTTLNAVIRLKANDTVSWHGVEWEGIGVKLSETGRSSDDETKRPKLEIANYDGLFSAAVASGHLDNALVKRYRVLREDLLSNNLVYQLASWRVRRVTLVNKERVQLELRDQLDGQFFQLPGRMFIPPEFPQVSLR